MAAAATSVPIEHNQIVHWVRTTRSIGEEAAFGAVRPAQAATAEAVPAPRAPSRQYTLLQLVEAIAEVTDDEREIVATVAHLLHSGQVRLCGNFRDEPVERILADAQPD